MQGWSKQDGTPSLPAWGVWIEMTSTKKKSERAKSLPAWGVWIEIYVPDFMLNAGSTSLPAWGVWIEIASEYRC